VKGSVVEGPEGIFGRRKKGPKRGRITPEGRRGKKISTQRLARKVRISDIRSGNTIREEGKGRKADEKNPTKGGGIRQGSLKRSVEAAVRPKKINNPEQVKKKPGHPPARQEFRKRERVAVAEMFLIRKGECGLLR